jgi:predicted site-specific integrase-resolvase
MSAAHLKTLPSYISISEAGKRLGIPPLHLQDLIRVGTLKAARIKGEMVVDEEKVDEIATQPKKEDLEEYKQFSHLKGEPIWASEAARKYGAPQQTLSRWVKAKYIERLETDGYRVFLNEQDVAYCCAIYEKRKGQGRRIFNKDGTPYQTKKELKIVEKQ